MKRTALVTGGSKGIGAATAKRLAEDGYRTAIIARDAKPIAAVCAEIQAQGGEAVGITCDVTDWNSVNAALRRITGEMHSVDILVNNAGVGGPFHRIDEVEDHEYETIFATNVRASFWFCRAFLPCMKSRGFGRIINIGSVQSLRGAAFSSTYAATKHAIVGYTKSLACEWGQWGITCNVICPGYVSTGMLPDHFDESSGLKDRIPARRFAEPQEIADMVSFLARPTSGYFNGAVLTVDGGLIAGYDSATKDHH